MTKPRHVLGTTPRPRHAGCSDQVTLSAPQADILQFHTGLEASPPPGLSGPLGFARNSTVWIINHRRKRRHRQDP